MIKCEWCGSEAKHAVTNVYWELPDGSRAVEIRETPAIFCASCNMDSPDETVVKEIEDQLFLVDTKQIGKSISYVQLMSLPRLLKRNYFDFLS